VELFDVTKIRTQKSITNVHAEYKQAHKSHACTVVLGKLLQAMYVSKGKPKICTPHSYQIDEPRTTKIGMGQLGLYLTPSVKFSYNWCTGAGAVNTPFHVDFGFIFF
jgi:hypothetical protein